MERLRKLVDCGANSCGDFVAGGVGKADIEDGPKHSIYVSIAVKPDLTFIFTARQLLHTCYCVSSSQQHDLLLPGHLGAQVLSVLIS